MTREEPNEFTILLRIVEVLGVSLRESSKNSKESHLHAELINIISTIESGGMLSTTINENSSGDQEIIVGDNYTTGQAGSVGPLSHSSGNTFNQVWAQRASNIDLEVLATELEALRSEMRKHADAPEDDLALAEVGQAQLAASAGDGAKSMSHLAKAGKWALGVATSIGTNVAVAAIKAAMGT